MRAQRHNPIFSLAMLLALVLACTSTATAVPPTSTRAPAPATRPALTATAAGLPVLALVVAPTTTTAPTNTQPRAASQPPSATPTSAPSTTPTSAPSPTATAAHCTLTDQDLYVYNPGRLRVLAACLRVSGVIDVIRTEADGDLHILPKVDPEFTSLLRPTNQGEELGDLVVEPVCVKSVTQADAESTCAADQDPFAGPLPAVGQHVWLEGRYVLDVEHGSWAELHPLYRWEPLGASPFTTAPAPPAATRVRVTFTPAPPGQPTATQPEQIAPTETQGAAAATDTQAPAATATPAQARARIGALCNDGSSSNATGSGACSHHGGVKCWKYNDGTCTKP